MHEREFRLRASPGRPTIERVSEVSPPRTSRQRRLLALAAIALVAGAGAAGFHWWSRREAPRTDRRARSLEYAGSAACSKCHAEIAGKWASSHHAAAERVFDPAVLGAALPLPAAIDESASRAPVRVIGVEPLWQLLVEFPGGRVQTTSLAYDPERHEWFDIFVEPRGPHEWSFWTNRGMTWNTMCGTCHNTGYEKRYDPARDTFATRLFEAGVGCEACHGPSLDHARDPGAEAPGGLEGGLGKVSGSLVEVCAPCHSRREEIAAGFVPGLAFLDHFRPMIPDLTETYWPDGQVRDEDYEAVSFFSSRMFAQGVLCVDCHDPHSGKTVRKGNALCLECHGEKIDPAAHAHHDPGAAGGQCVSCHMPMTTYMARHPRRDHGFTIPDPALSIEAGIPNACNRCHEDKDSAWALAAARDWWGDPLERPSFRRARTLASAWRGDEKSLGPLLALARDEPSGFWRAVAIGMLEPWVARSGAVEEAVLAALADPDPLARSAALRAASGVAEARSVLFLPLVTDPVRLVRIDAAWSLRRSLPRGHPSIRELEAALLGNSDHPAAALRLAELHQDRGEPAPALTWVRHAASLDPGSPAIARSLADAELSAGSEAGWIAALRGVVQANPADARGSFELALALAERANRLENTVPAPAAEARSCLVEAAGLFERAVVLDPAFARCWHNLALARSQLGDLEAALAASARALELAPRDHDFLYARVTLLARAERHSDALATLRVLEALAPPRADWIETRARLLTALGDEKGARRALEEVARFPGPR